MPLLFNMVQSSILLFTQLHFSRCIHSYTQAESSEWSKRTVDVAAAVEDASAINEMHDAVLGKTLFAVDAPDGEHDLEDVVSSNKSQKHSNYFALFRVLSFN